MCSTQNNCIAVQLKRKTKLIHCYGILRPKGSWDSFSNVWLFVVLTLHSVTFRAQRWIFSSRGYSPSTCIPSFQALSWRYVAQSRRVYVQTAPIYLFSPKELYLTPVNKILNVIESWQKWNILFAHYLPEKHQSQSYLSWDNPELLCFQPIKCCIKESTWAWSLGMTPQPKSGCSVPRLIWSHAHPFPDGMSSKTETI